MLNDLDLDKILEFYEWLRGQEFERFEDEKHNGTFEPTDTLFSRTRRN